MIRKHLFAILIVLVSIKFSAQVVVNLTPSVSCIGNCSGSLLIELNNSLLDPSMQPPFEIEITSLSSGESTEYNTVDFKYNVDGLCVGN